MLAPRSKRRTRECNAYGHDVDSEDPPLAVERRRAATIPREDSECPLRVAWDERLCSNRFLRAEGPTMEFWATLLGAAVGVVAGTLVQYGVQALTNYSTERNQRSALKKEVQLNLALVAEIKAEATRLRNAINGDALPKYFGYLNFERGLFSQSNVLLSNGKLYNWFSIDELRKLQVVSFKLNASTANFVNQNITQRRERATARENYDKSEAVQFANYIDNQLSEIEKLLNEIISAV